MDIHALFCTFISSKTTVQICFLQEYVQLRIQRDLVDAVKPQLDAMKRGFESIPIKAHMRLFSSIELMGLLQGKCGVCESRDLSAYADMMSCRPAVHHTR